MGRKERKIEAAENIIKDIAKYLTYLGEEAEERLSTNKTNFITTRPAHNVHHTRACDACYHGFEVEESIRVKYHFEFSSRCDKRSVASGRRNYFYLRLRLQVIDMVYHMDETYNIKDKDNDAINSISLRPLSDHVCKEQICYNVAKNSDEVKKYFKEMREITRKANEYIKYTYNVPIILMPYYDELFVEARDTKGNPEQYREYFMDMAILSQRHENKIALSSVLETAKKYGVELDLSQESISKHLEYKKEKGYDIRPASVLERVKKELAEKQNNNTNKESNVFICDKTKGQTEFRNAEGLTKKDIAKRNARSKEQILKDMEEAKKRKAQTQSPIKKEKRPSKSFSSKSNFFSKIKKKMSNIWFNIKWKFRKRHHGSDDLDYQQKLERKSHNKEKSYKPSSVSFDFDYVSFIWILIPTIIIVILSILSCFNLVADGRQMLEDWGHDRLNNIQTFLISKTVVNELLKGSFMADVFILLRLVLYLVFGALTIISGIVDIVLLVIYFLFMAVLTFGVFWFIGYMFMYFIPVVATIFVLIRTIISVGRKENTIQSIVALLVCIAGTIVYYVTFAPANMSL